MDFATESAIWSAEMFRLYGRDPALGAPSFAEFLEMVHPEDRDQLLEARRRAIGSSGSAATEFRTNPQRGPERHISGVLQGIGEASGRVVQLAGTEMDVTERRKTEEALRRSEDRYRHLVDRAPDVIYGLGGDGTISSLSTAFEKITGWSCDEWVGKPFAGLVHPDDLPAALASFQSVLRGEQPPPLRTAGPIEGGRLPGRRVHQ